MANQLIERIPPHNKEAEISVLGSILIDSNVLLDVASILHADDFYEEAHKEIYNAIMQLHFDSKPVDLITVSECLKKRHSLEAVGGRSYVAGLADVVPTSANAKEYAQIVNQKATLRSLISASSEIVAKCYEEKLEPERILDNAEETILAIAQEKQKSGYTEISKILEADLNEVLEAQKNGGKIPGLSTGFTDLDKKTSGLADGDFIIVAARPSMGKTAFAINIAQNAALHSNARVAIFSLEMTKEQLGMRMLSMESRVDSKKLKVGDVSNDDIEDINKAINRLSKTQIFIDDTPGMGVMEIRNKCRRLAEKAPLDLIVIDYLQMMSMGGASESRVQEVSTISRYLKQLAREMKCPLICLSQLSRAVEQRKESSHRPILSDLRESGAIEQDADMVMFLYREDYYKDKDAPQSNTCEIIIAKNRNGETGVVELAWHPQFTRFTNKASVAMEKRYVEQPAATVAPATAAQAAPAPAPAPAEDFAPVDIPADFEDEEYEPDLDFAEQEEIDF
ncbi:MAG: replicative DNA helicase [Bacillota bacterium]|nr:replicative DNA helicase [Bacillota bacterium]